MAARALILAASVAVCSALRAPVAVRSTRPAVSRSSTVQAAIDFDAAAAEWAAQNPYLAKYGFGPTPKAERWNGRHAMFGWVCIVATAWCKSHGVFDSSVLSYQNWGGLAQIGFGEYISNERAVIMMAHVHFLAISLVAAFSNDAFGPKYLDTLTLLDGEKGEEPSGIMPPLKSGLTPAAEMLNGRLAMLGIIAVVLTSAFTGKDILEVTNIGLGGILS